MILQGKIFISTVSIEKSSKLRKLLEPLGATLLEFPMTEILPAELTDETAQILSGINRYHWIVFTSANGVKYFLRMLSELSPGKVIPDSVKVAVIGTQTASELERSGRKPDFVSKGNTADDLANELLARETLHHKNILLPLGDLAPDTLREKLSIRSVVTRITAYHTLKSGHPDPEIVSRVRSGQYDMILFTSPSAVEHFGEIFKTGQSIQPFRIASIGPVTDQAVRLYGMNSTITAGTSTYSGLVHEITKYYNFKTS